MSNKDEHGLKALGGQEGMDIEGLMRSKNS